MNNKRGKSISKYKWKEWEKLPAATAWKRYTQSKTLSSKEGWEGTQYVAIEQQNLTSYWSY